jgi:hypothetical protein
MGNINCCEETKKNDKDFDVGSIFAPKVNKEEENLSNKSTEEENYKIHTNQNEIFQLAKSPFATNKNSIFIEELAEAEDFDYDTNNNKNSWLNYIENRNKEMDSKNLLKLVKHATFRDTPPTFDRKFLEDLNKARTDFLAFSEKLFYYVQNFHIIQNKIDEIKDETIKKRLSRTKEDFIQASDLFKKLHGEKKENLNELIEIDEFKLPIPSNIMDLKEKKIFEKFDKRIQRKQNLRKFRLRNIKCCIVQEDIELSFILFITKEINYLSFLFNKNMKYIGIDFKENSNGTNLLTIVLVSDK